MKAANTKSHEFKAKAKVLKDLVEHHIQARGSREGERGYHFGMRIAIWIVTTAITAPLLAQRGNPQVAFGGESVDAMVAAFMKEHDVPGMSLAIVQAPYITRAVGYGVSDTAKRTLVSANSLFDIAQMKNAFTAVAVMQLVETGKLTLDADLRRLLLNGRDYAPLEALVAKASGQTYEQFVRKNQFERLGLKDTFFGSDLPSASRDDRRFLRDATLIDPTEPARGSNGVVNGAAIYATASDISIWDIGLAGQILIKDPVLRKVLYEGHVTSGPWNFPGHPGLMIATGSAAGFSSLLSRFTNPNELICVTLLANREGLDLTQLARKIAGAHNPKTGPPLEAAAMRVQQSPYPLSETRARIERLLGAGVVRVWEDNGEVWVAVRDEPKTRKTIDEKLLRAVSAD